MINSIEVSSKSCNWVQHWGQTCILFIICIINSTILVDLCRFYHINECKSDWWNEICKLRIWIKFNFYTFLHVLTCVLEYNNIFYNENLLLVDAIYSKSISSLKFDLMKKNFFCGSSHMNALYRCPT